MAGEAETEEVMAMRTKEVAIEATIEVTIVATEVMKTKNTLKVKNSEVKWKLVNNTKHLHKTKNE